MGRRYAKRGAAALRKDAWPVVVSIGRPSPKTLTTDLDAVKRHVFAWRQVRIGKVVWKPVRYRATADAVEIPTQWRLQKPSEWLEACADVAMRKSSRPWPQLLSRWILNFIRCSFESVRCGAADRRRKSPSGAACNGAVAVLCGGRPLRMLSMEGIDTKFFERHAQLVTALLDVRFDGEVGRIGLERFSRGICRGRSLAAAVGPQRIAASV